MKFSYQENAEVPAGTLIYISKDQSLYFEPFFTQLGFSVMIAGAYTSLDVGIENGEAKQISGCNPKHLWKDKKLELPSALKGKLFVQLDEPIISGSGLYYVTGWVTYYDKSKNLICIGNPGIRNTDVCIEFVNGIYAVLNGNQLSAIWAKIKDM
jgi:hypothetical protein